MANMYWGSIDFSFNITFKRLWIIRCLPNLNLFPEGSIDRNTDLVALITESFTPWMKKILCEKLCTIINTGLEWIYILTRIKIIVQDMWWILLRRTTTPWFYKDISSISWQSIFSKFFLDTLHVISSKCLERGWILSGWLGEYNWSSLGWMKKCYSTSKSYQYWLDRLGPISIPDALSKIIFYFIFWYKKIELNGKNQLYANLQ